MNSQKIQDLIDKIAQNTKKNKLKWGRVTDLFHLSEINNQLLKQYVLMQERSSYFYNNNVGIGSLNQYRSFYSEINQGYVYLFQYIKYKSSYFVLAVQSSKYSDIVELNQKDDFQPKLIELDFLVREQIDNYVEYVDSILEEL